MIESKILPLHLLIHLLIYSCNTFKELILKIQTNTEFIEKCRLRLIY